jgi:hypothetical protein
MTDKELIEKGNVIFRILGGMDTENGRNMAELLVRFKNNIIDKDLCKNCLSGHDEKNCLNCKYK